MNDKSSVRQLIEDIGQKYWPSASVTVRDALLAAQMGYDSDTVKRWRLGIHKPAAWVICHMERLRADGQSGA